MVLALPNGYTPDGCRCDIGIADLAATAAFVATPMLAGNKGIEGLGYHPILRLALALCQLQSPHSCGAVQQSCLRHEPAALWSVEHRLAAAVVTSRRCSASNHGCLSPCEKVAGLKEDDIRRPGYPLQAWSGPDHECLSPCEKVAGLEEDEIRRPGYLLRAWNGPS